MLLNKQKYKSTVDFETKLQSPWGNNMYLFLGRHDAIFVVGALDETIMLRGMRYHPIDIEMSVVRCHRKICEW